MKKKFLVAVLTVLVLAMSSLLLACDPKEEEPPAPTTYTITFVGGTGATGTAPTMENKAAGATFTLPANTFAKENHTFTGWNDGSQTYAAGATYTMGATNVTFTAQWEEDEEPAPQTYTITFEGGEGATGTAPTMENKAEGATFTLPANTFAKENHTFTGWHDGNQTYAAGASYTMGAANVTFTAQWEKDLEPAFSTEPFNGLLLSEPTTEGTPNQKECAGFINFGSDGTVYLEYYRVDTSFPFFNSYAEYTLSGNTVTITGTDSAESGLTYPIQGTIDGRTITITLEFSYFSKTYTVTFCSTLYGLTIKGGEANPTAEGLMYYPQDYEVDLSMYEMEATGHKQTGWKDGSNNSYAIDGTLTLTADTEITAQWEVAAKYVLTFITDATPAQFTAELTQEQAAAYKTPRNWYFTSGSSNSGVTYPALSKPNYTLKGWKLQGTDTLLGQGASYPITADTTFVAVWEANEPEPETLTVTLELGDGTLYEGMRPSFDNVFEVEANVEFTLPYAKRTGNELYVKTTTGDILVGWKKNNTGAMIAPGTVVTVTETVSYTAVYGYGITFECLYLGTSDSVGVLKGESYTVPEVSFTRPGYVFLGWAEKSNATVPDYRIGATITPEDNLTLYDVWEEDSTAKTYTVTFVGGEGATGTAPTVSPKYEGEDFELPANTFTKEGFTFEGWDDGEQVYAPGNAYTMGAANVTFTAKWVEDSGEQPPAENGSIKDHIGSVYSGDTLWLVGNTYGVVKVVIGDARDVDFTTNQGGTTNWPSYTENADKTVSVTWNTPMSGGESHEVSVTMTFVGNNLILKASDGTTVTWTKTA